jgi:hypothetical protein
MGLTVRRHDVDVPGMERRNCHGTSPEDKVLRVLADLAKSEDVTLTNLVEAGKS